ncbi:TPA: hypothetical protein ACGONB_001372 [Streptococcus suis]
MKYIKSILTSLTLLLTLILVACSPTEEGDRIATSENGAFVSFKEIEKEYLDSLNNLNWPEGTVLPTALEGEIADSFQVGYGDTKASILWEYSWQKEWLETYNTDPARAQAALEELEKALDMGYMSSQRADDSTRNYFRDILDKAKLGDPSGFEESLRANQAH